MCLLTEKQMMEWDHHTGFSYFLIRLHYYFVPRPCTPVLMTVSLLKITFARVFSGKANWFPPHSMLPSLLTCLPCNTSLFIHTAVYTMFYVYLHQVSNKHTFTLTHSLAHSPTHMHTNINVYVQFDLLCIMFGVQSQLKINSISIRCLSSWYNIPLHLAITPHSFHGCFFWRLIIMRIQYMWV